MADAYEAVEFLRQSMDADNDNRIAALDDVQFRYGKQWPEYAMTTRGLERPQLTINEMDAYIRQVTNSQRQQRPRGKCQPVDNFADPKIAKVITGIMRHVEVNSDADHAYDTAFDWAATIGWGYMRMRMDYVSQDSFDQDIFIDVIDNPFTVCIDRNSNLPDGSDMQKALITDLISRDDFMVQYPGAQASGFSERATGDGVADWESDQEVRLAEYFYIERVRSKLVRLTDGSVLWADQLPSVEILKSAGTSIASDRMSLRDTVKWQKQTASEILETRDIPGKYIPIIPVYWTSVIIDGKRLREGMVRPAKDPQRMVNFWNTAITELIALAPKAKWLVSDRAIEGHDKEFANANNSTSSYLTYNDRDDNLEPIEKPERLQPEPPPEGAMAAASLASQYLQRVMGMFDPAVRSQEPKSGKAIRAEQGQSEMSNSHGYDNLTRSIKQVWRIGLGWVPIAFKEPGRVQRVIGADGRDSLVTLNKPSPGDAQTTEDAIAKVLNDVTVGTYDVVMEVGPGYETKRQEGVASMLQLLDTPLGEEVSKVGSDIIIREMDFNGSDVLADRMAAMNPVAQIDEESDVPAPVQMQIKALTQKLEQAGQHIQALEADAKYGMSVAQLKEAGMTNRTHMQSVTKAHDIEMRDQTRQHDTETKAQTALSVAEINAVRDLLLQMKDHQHAEQIMQRELAHAEHQEQTKAAEVAA